MAVNSKDDEALKRIINYPRRGIGQTTVNKLTTVADANAMSIWQCLTQIKFSSAAAPKDMDVLLAKGISLTELGKYKEAHQAFAYIKSLNPRLKKFQWFDAHCYLREGNTAQAKTLLEDLVATKAYNYKQAQELLATFK